MDLIYLAAAFVVVWLARMLRAFGAVPYSRARAAWTDERPPEVLAPLYQGPLSALRALGFEDARWVEVEFEREARTVLLAVLAHPEGGVVWLGPPIFGWTAKRIYLMATSRLADGRSVYTQNYDVFFSVSPTDEIVGHAVGEPEIAGFVGAHRAFVATLGSPPIVEDDATILDFQSGALERQRLAMIADGRLEAVDDALALPRPRMALRILKAFLSRPKPPPEKGPIAAELLEKHVARAEQIAARAPLRSVEIALLVSSVVAFAIAGALLWDVQFALLILVVIVVHELGHYVAMRAAGYENVHFLALPLVGGVTLGRDASPTATKQAWTSLMGPLPGIVIGGVLFVWASIGGHETQGGHVYLAAVLFVAVNYLNLVPVPPFDGGKVLEAMIPPRYAKVQSIAFASVMVVAAIVCAFTELWIFTGVLALQLFGLKRRWRLHDVEADLARQYPPGRDHDATPARVVLEALERRLGPATSLRRVTEAVAVRDRLRTQPMGWGGRLVTGGLYFSAFGAPAAVALTLGLLGALSSWGGYDGSDLLAESDAMAARYESMSTRERLEAGTSSVVPAAATAQQISDAEARLGRTLPPELRSLYAIADGVPGLGIAPVASVRAATREDFEAVGEVYYRGASPIVLSSLRPDGVLAIGVDGTHRLLWSIADPVFVDQRFVYVERGLAFTASSLDAWIEATTLGNMHSAVYERAMRRGQDRARSELRDATFDQVLDRAFASTEGGWLFRAHRGEGATEATIRATEERLGVTLPAQWSAVLQRHDPPELISMLGSGDIVRQADSDLSYGFAYAVDTATTALGTRIERPSPAVLFDCLIAAGDRGDDRVRALLLWCPSRPADARWLDVARGVAYAELRDWLSEAVARQAPFRN